MAASPVKAAKPVKKSMSRLELADLEVAAGPLELEDTVAV